MNNTNTKKINIVKKGFTLIELMVVVAIIGIGASATIGSDAGSFFRSDAKLNATKNRFHNALKYARALAILSKQDVCVAQVSLNKKMAFCGTTPVPNSARSTLMFNKLQALMNKEIKQPTGTTISSNQISFTSLGMRNGGANYISFQATVDGVVQRYLIEVSIAGTTRSCKEKDINIIVCK